MKYGLNDKPPLGIFLLNALQWWMVTLPCLVIMGVVAARLLYGADVGPQIFYLQKIFVIIGLTTVVQVLWGHKLPLVVGPAAILLVGIIASKASAAATYTAIFISAGFLTLAAVTGFLSCLRSFFTVRIVAVILILIPFTLSPTILKLVFDGTGQDSFHFAFSALMVLALLLLNKFLPGSWRSLTITLGVVGASLCYFLLTSFPSLLATTPKQYDLWPGFQFDPGTVFSFLFCFLALTVNELGSIESLGHLLKADDMAGRIKRGAGLTGLANMASGAVGVLGPVDYSLSAGVIAGTGCASRYTLGLGGLGVVGCAFFPGFVGLLASLPGVVMGGLLFYLMGSQLATGLTLLTAENGVHDFNSGVCVALPLMTGIFIAFAPASAFAGFAVFLQPIIANGFVMGTITVAALEHLIFRGSKKC